MSNSTGNESIHRLIEELKKSDGENRAIKEQLISYKVIILLFVRVFVNLSC